MCKRVRLFMKRMADSGFSKASSNNLPVVDVAMIVEFLSTNDNFVSAEVRGVKNLRATRSAYGDSAIGYVQIRRDGSTCIIKARITPEHRIRNKAYNASVVLNEQEEKILTAECHDCAASAVGCKHALALVMWLHRRSEDPSPTLVECYWKRSKMSAIGSTLKFVKSQEFSKKPFAWLQTDKSFIADVIKEGESNNCNGQLLKHFLPLEPVRTLSLHNMLIKFVSTGSNDFQNFIKFCKSKMPQDLCTFAEELTKAQSDCPLWHELRFARITASKMHDVARCKTPDGSLKEIILGANKIKDTKAMKRGRELESAVIKVVENKLDKKVNKIGLILSEELPIFGASPDGVCEDFVLEVKCPCSEKAFKRYINLNNEVLSKYYAQIQMQMHMLNKPKGLFCVASPIFEESKNVTTISVNYDNDYCLDLIDKCLTFWEQNVFPTLLQNLM